MCDQKGQVLIIVLMLISLLLGMLLFSAALIKWIQVKNHTESLCRKHYLKAQSYVVKYGNRLKKLNPQATRLRNKKRRLIAQSLIVKEPASLAYILYKISETHMKQKKLQAKQKAIIKLAKYKIDLQINDLKTEILKLYSLYSSKFPPVSFKLHKTHFYSITPNYYFPPNFSSSQTVTASWQWLEIDYFKKVFTFNCSVGVSKKGLEWKPQMKKVKPPLSLLPAY